MSEATPNRRGRRALARRAATRKTTAKRTAPAKRAGTRKTTAKRSAPAKRAATRKTPAKRTAPAKRAGTRKTTAKRSAPAKRAGLRKTPAKRSTPAKRAATHKTPAKRTAPAKATHKTPAKRMAPAKATHKTAAKRTAPAKPAAPAGRSALAQDEQALQARLAEATRAAGAPAEVLEALRRDPYAALEWLVPLRPTLPAAQVQAVSTAAEALLRRRILVHPAARGERLVPVVFGTGGHRGVIGSGLTLLHVYAIVTALLRAIARMTPAQRAEAFGAAALEDVQRRGFVLGHDNRLFNPEFSFYAASLLREGGYAVRYAGRVSSPELSLIVPRRGWAGSLNFTPSHNPFRWGGLKFAPADGGLAGGDLTDPLAAEANRLLQATAPAAWPAPAALEARIRAEAERIERVDVHDPYLDALDEHPLVRLGELFARIRALPAGERLAYVADPTWGAAVPIYQRLQRRLGADVLQVIHTEVDPYFGGQVTEPNEHTLGDALAVLRQSPARHKVMIRNDPDSDRGLVGDGEGALQMNRFAAVVYRYLRDTGHAGDLVTTLPTSHEGPDYARAHGGRVLLTATGFKNFRPHLRGGQALMAYEESNGITVRGHTLDKDGILAGLLAVRIVLHYGRSLADLARELEAELGRYYYRQETFAIDMSAAEAHQRLRRLGAVQPGQSVGQGAQARPIVATNAEDGYKFTLERGAWVMMRPSGTEPKVRIYAETRESAQATADLCSAAREMALAAIHGR